MLRHGKLFIDGIALKRDGELDADACHYIVHIPMMTWSPFRPTVQVMSDRGERSVVDNRILHKTGRFLNYYEWCKLVAAGLVVKRWQIDFLILHTSERPLARVDPS